MNELLDVNVVRQTVSKWENGLSVPDSSILISLADELANASVRSSKKQELMSV